MDYQFDKQEFSRLLTIAEDFFKQKNYKQAEKYYRIVININSDFDYILNSLSICLIRQEKYKNAQKYLKKALAINPNDNTYLYNLSYCFFELGNYEKALYFLTKITLDFYYIDRAYELIKITRQAIKYDRIYKHFKNIKKVFSLCEYIEAISEIKKGKEDTTFIYRGQRNHFYPLKPSLYRESIRLNEKNPLIKERIENEYKKLEKNITKEFNLKAVAYFNHEMDHFDEVDKLALMQHYRVPTKLLDFTESPLIALYFALEDIDEINYYGKAPCVYVLNIGGFKFNGDGHILSSSQVSNVIDEKTFDSYYEKDNFAFSPKLKNKRLTAQNGIFVAFNKNTTLEASLDEDYLTKIIIPRQKISKIKQELKDMGITPTTIYPDFEGLAKEIKKPRDFAEPIKSLDNKSEAL